MKITKLDVTIGDLVKGYSDDGEGGVRGLDGKLNIRPEYQREEVYKDKHKKDVITSVLGGFPINPMYWTPQDDGGYGKMDGQQRTIAISQYATDWFSVNGRFFSNLTSEEREQFESYKLDVYLCEGTEKERLDWFERINIGGLELNAQEKRGAIYAGKWLSDAKRYFCRVNQGADQERRYLSGRRERQDYLATAIKWAAGEESIEDYMGRHQRDENASPLWQHFQEVIAWVKRTFPKYRKEMKGLDWGRLYREYGQDKRNAEEDEARITKLLANPEVTQKSGVYEHILSGKNKFLYKRAFSEQQKRTKYEEQEGVCAITGKHFPYEAMEGDHIIKWEDDGPTTLENCQMVSMEANRKKG